ncbi:unnamed protein product, partial [Tetraodon nigroviridis]
VSETLKKFSVKVTTASVKERKQILEELKQCVKGRGEILLLLCFLQISFSSICCFQPDLTLPHISPSELPEAAIRGLCKLFCLTPHRYSKSSGSAAFVALSWTCLLTARVFSAPEKREGPLWKKMVEVQSLLAAEVVGGAKTKAQKSILKHFNHLWKQVSSGQSLNFGQTN